MKAKNAETRAPCKRTNPHPGSICVHPELTFVWPEFPHTTTQRFVRMQSLSTGPTHSTHQAVTSHQALLLAEHSHQCKDYRAAPPTSRQRGCSLAHPGLNRTYWAPSETRIPPLPVPPFFQGIQAARLDLCAWCSHTPHAHVSLKKHTCNDPLEQKPGASPRPASRSRPMKVLWALSPR